jgi:hypothetical protein
MRQSLLLSTAALAGGLGLGCGVQPSPSGPDDPISTEPAAGRPQARAQNSFFQFPNIPISDSDRNLTLIVGVPLSQVTECGGPGAPDQSRQHVVLTPSGIEHVLNRVRQGNLELYDRFDENGCGLTPDDLAGTGTGNATVRSWEDGSVIRGALNVTGTIELLDGGRAQVHAVANFSIDLDPFTLTVHVDRLDVRPIGRQVAPKQ